MAIVNCNFFSNELGMNTDVCVIMPERRQQPHVPLNGKKYPVLYLLHGHSGDHTSWIRGTQLEFVLQATDLIVVMPNCHRSWFTDGKRTHGYFSYLTKELPMVMEDWFPISKRRADRYIAGLSMGGYGAFKAGLRRPDLYAGAISLSGALDPFFDKKQSMAGLNTFGMPVRDDVDMNMANIFGGAEAIDGSYDDLFQAAKDLNASSGPKPKFYMCCGTDDFLFETNNRYYKTVKACAPGLDLVYETSEGIHNWAFWDREIRGALDHFGLIGFTLPD